MPSSRISSVTFEHCQSGLGIGYANPRISWRVAADETAKNWVQESYEIKISRGHNVEPSTFSVKSAESILVPWPGPALQSRESASVQVRVHGTTKDESGSIVQTATEWSDPAPVEAALLHKGDWDAKLTSSALASNGGKAAIRPVLFRKSFSLPENAGAVAKARLYVTAHGVYQAFLNGERVGQEEMAPGWTSYKHRLLYQTFDVTASLVSDKANVFGVEVGEGWFATRLAWEAQRCIYGSQLGFLAQLEVEFEDGKSYRMVSDSTWKSRRSPTTRSEIYDGEDYDACDEEPGWNSDPQLDESSWTKTEELSFPAGKLVAAELPPVRVTETISEPRIFKSESGKVLVDFGQNLVGKLQVQLPTPTSDNGLEGKTISIIHAEVLEHGELGTRPLRSAKATDRIILSTRQLSVWSPKFTFHGFRYVQIDGWPTEDELPPNGAISALVMHSDMARTGWFSCSDPLINKLHQNVVWSMRGNFLSVPTDCPQRDERLGWTGDIQVFSPSANFLFDTTAFLRSWLTDVSDEQLEEGKGSVPGLVVPDVLGSGVPLGAQAVWHDCTVLTPWDLYHRSGDLDLLRSQYPSMRAWVDVGIPRGQNGLWDQNHWQFGDWLDPAAPPDEPAMGRTDTVLVADAYLVHVLETISKISSLLGETEQAARYAQQATETKKAFQHEYVTRSGLLVGDTQTANTLAISFGLFDTPEHFAKASSRLAHLIHQAKYRISTGFAGTPLITHALTKVGQVQLAYRMLLEQQCPSWLYPISMGATTIWERWDSMLPDGSINPGAMTSFNHYALGSVADWLHSCVGGIRPLDAGWKTVVVNPRPGGTITSAEVAFDGPYGRIECSWSLGKDGDTFSMSVLVPPNTEAVIILPGSDGDALEKEARVGSGRHEFSCAYTAPEWPPKAELTRSTLRLE